MPIFSINSVDDPRLVPYRDMKERDLARGGGRFIAEGEQVVRRLLDSTLRTESVLLSTRKVSVMAGVVPDAVDTFVADDSIIKQTMGFAFHSGVIACGLRPDPPKISDIASTASSRSTLAVCQAISNTENLGSMIRIAAAFGCDAMVLGETCCDPFFRQSVRVSMGTVFRLPIVRSRNLAKDLKSLRDEWGYERLATVLEEDAEPLASAARSGKIAIVFGNEAQGLDETTIAACDRKITIPMKWGTDSLNVAVAAGVILYHLTQIV